MPTFEDVIAWRMNTASRTGARNYELCCLRRARKWLSNMSAPAGKGVVSGLSFSRPHLERAFQKITPARLRLSRKSVQNTLSACLRVADEYAIRAPEAELSSAARELLAWLPTKYERIHNKKVLLFLSSTNRRPDDMCDALVPEFRSWLTANMRSGASDRIADLSLRAWNKAIDNHDFWPRARLARPRQSARKWLPLQSFPPTLATSIDSYVANRTSIDALFGDQEPATWSPATARLKRTGFLLAANALVQHGSPIQEIDGIDAICKPEVIKTALRRLKDHFGAVTRTLEMVAETVVQAALFAYPVEPERVELVAILKRVRKEHQKYRMTREDRDQKLLNDLDDPATCDALLSLSTRTAEYIATSCRRHTLAAAYAIQRALVLEIWLAAPLRLGNIISLRIDRHFFDIELEGKSWLLLSVPAGEVKNNEPLEHFLTPNGTELLKLYVSEFLPIIQRKLNSTDSPYLFPGENGTHKEASSFRQQMNGFIRKETGLDFHPHAIRKIVPKILLDIDPGALEIARRAGGWKSFKMLHKIYGQRVNRAAQAKYMPIPLAQAALGMSGDRRR